MQNPDECIIIEQPSNLEKVTIEYTIAKSHYENCINQVMQFPGWTNALFNICIDHLKVNGRI